MKNISLIKKILSALVIPVVVMYSFFLINSSAPVANGTDIWYKIKEYIIIPIVRTVANSITAKMHNRVKQTIAGLNGKGPQFIQNWRDEINDTESRGIDIFRTVLSSAELCPHLDTSIKQTFLADTYKSSTANSKRTGEKVRDRINTCSQKNIELKCLNKTGNDKNLCVYDETLSCVSNASKNENYRKCLFNDLNQLDDSDLDTTDKSFKNVKNTALVCVQNTIIGLDKKSPSEIVSSITNQFIPAGETPFSVISKCTLPNNFNIETFGDNFIEQGGLATFRKLLDPQNNKLGFLTFIANPAAELQKKLTKSAEDQERNSGSGYKPFREGQSSGSSSSSTSGSSGTGFGGIGDVCGGSGNLPCSVGLTCSNGRCVKNAGFGESCAGGEGGESSTCPNGLVCVQKTSGSGVSSFTCLECGSNSDCARGSTCSSDGECIAGEGEPLGALCDISKPCAKGLQCSNANGGFCEDPNLIKKDECPEEERIGPRCIKLGGIVTPGAILGSAIGGTLGSQVNKLVHARDWTDLIAGLIEIVGSQLNNFIEAKLNDENPRVVSDGNQYAQQNPNNGVNDANSNGTDAYSNLNQCLANCDAQGAAECVSKEADKQSVCENTKRLACYGTCSADSKGESTNKIQKRRLGDSCEGDNANDPELSYTPVNQNDEANPPADTQSICAFAINKDLIPNCTPSATNNCTKAPLVCYKQTQICLQCIEDSDCDKFFPEIPGKSNTKRICDRRFPNENETDDRLKVGVCVRENGGNLDKEACMDDSQCTKGLVCNGNHRCRPPGATANAISNGTASASFSEDFTLLIQDIDPATDDFVCPNAEESDNCTLGIDPDQTLDLDIILNSSKPDTLEEVQDVITAEKIDGSKKMTIPYIQPTRTDVAEQTSINLDETLPPGLGLGKWKAYIKNEQGNTNSNIIYFEIVDSR